MNIFFIVNCWLVELIIASITLLAHYYIYTAYNCVSQYYTWKTKPGNWSPVVGNKVLYKTIKIHPSIMSNCPYLDTLVWLFWKGKYDKNDCTLDGAYNCIVWSSDWSFLSLFLHICSLWNYPFTILVHCVKVAGTICCTAVHYLVHFCPHILPSIICTMQICIISANES